MFALLIFFIPAIVSNLPLLQLLYQGYVEATPEHPLEAASAAALAPSGHHHHHRHHADDSNTFVTQATPGMVTEEGRRSSLELLAERGAEVAPGGGVVGAGANGLMGSTPLGEGGGRAESRPFSTPASPRLVGVSHQPHAPLIV